MEITPEQVRRLREKTGLSDAQARAALEHAGGDLLDALIWLEQQGQVPPPEGGGCCSTAPVDRSRDVLDRVISASAAEEEAPSSPLQRLPELLRELVRKGMIHELSVSRRGQAVTSLPLLAALGLLLVAPWVAIPLLLAGFLLGCRFDLTGPDLDREPVRRAMDALNDGADRLRHGAAARVRRLWDRRGGKPRKGN